MAAGVLIAKEEDRANVGDDLGDEGGRLYRVADSVLVGEEPEVKEAREERDDRAEEQLQHRLGSDYEHDSGEEQLANQVDALPKPELGSIGAREQRDTDSVVRLERAMPVLGEAVKSGGDAEGVDEEREDGEGEPLPPPAVVASEGEVCVHAPIAALELEAIEEAERLAAKGGVGKEEEPLHEGPDCGQVEGGAVAEAPGTQQQSEHEDDAEGEQRCERHEEQLRRRRGWVRTARGVSREGWERGGVGEGRRGRGTAWERDGVGEGRRVGWEGCGGCGRRSEGKRGLVRRRLSRCLRPRACQ